MGSTVFGFRHELWEGVEDDGMPHSQGFWRVAITAYMNIVKIIYKYSQCAEVSLVCFFMRCASLVYPSWPLGQPPGRTSPIESGTWWPFWFRHHDFSSCLSPGVLGLTSVLAVFPNDSHLRFVAAFVCCWEMTSQLTKSCLGSPALISPGMPVCSHPHADGSFPPPFCPISSGFLHPHILLVLITSSVRTKDVSTDGETAQHWILRKFQ